MHVILMTWSGRRYCSGVVKVVDLDSLVAAIAAQPAQTQASCASLLVAHAFFFAAMKAVFMFPQVLKAVLDDIHLQVSTRVVPPRLCLPGSASQVVPPRLGLTGSVTHILFPILCCPSSASQAVPPRLCLSGCASQVMPLRLCLPGCAAHASRSACHANHIQGFLNKSATELVLPMLAHMQLTCTP